MKHSEKMEYWRRQGPELDAGKKFYFECPECYTSKGERQGSIFVCQNGHRNEVYA